MLLTLYIYFLYNVNTVKIWEVDKMNKTDKLDTILNIFEGKEIRSIWDGEKEVKWLVILTS